jgi:hypothetical protein
VLKSRSVVVALVLVVVALYVVGVASFAPAPEDWQAPPSSWPVTVECPGSGGGDFDTGAACR